MKNLILTDEHIKQVEAIENQESMFLNPDEIADAVIAKLFLDDSPENAMRFVQNKEWNIYKDFPSIDTKEVVLPEFYD